MVLLVSHQNGPFTFRDLPTYSLCPPEEIAMRKIRFTEHQIIAVLKSVEAGRTVKDVCREAAISEASYYNWKAKYGGMEAADIKKIKDLEDENRRLKKLVADLSLDKEMLQEVLKQKFRFPSTAAVATETQELLVTLFGPDTPHSLVKMFTQPHP